MLEKTDRYSHFVTGELHSDPKKIKMKINKSVVPCENP